MGANGQQLVQAFIDELGGARGASESELADLLEQRLAEAAASWPDVVVSPAVFGRFVAARVPAAEPPLAALAALRTDDLYLTCGCALGDPAALLAFETRMVPEMRRALQRIGGAERVADDVLQTLRQRFLVAEGGAAPRVAQYSGQGPLVAWVKVAAVREGLRLTRRGDRERPSGDERLIEAAGLADDHELTYLKRLYRGEFEQAFVEALGRLSSRDRNLLRFRHVDDLSIDQIGEMQGVHRATVARWLAKIRDALLADTRAALGRRLKLSPTEFQSIMRLIQSQLHVSIARHLGEDNGDK